MTFYHSRGLRGFSSLPASCCGAPGSNIGRRSGGSIPCRGVPQTAQASAFKVISAPQHAQKAAIIIYSLQIAFAYWTILAAAKIHEGEICACPGIFESGRGALQIARDDKGRAITHLEVRESDGTEELTATNRNAFH